MLLTNLPIVAKDSKSLWWIVQIYLTRWKIEELSASSNRATTWKTSA